MTISRRQLFGAIAAVTIAGGGFAAWSRLGAATAKRVNTLDSPNGAAIKGYDPVAYFVVGKPVRGKAEYSVSHAGATWLFANAEHKSLFQANPEKYTPVFGGYCAYGVSQGYLVKIEPEAWTIKDGKLYLNYDLEVRKTWEKDTAGYIDKASKTWPGLVGAK